MSFARMQNLKHNTLESAYSTSFLFFSGHRPDGYSAMTTILLDSFNGNLSKDSIKYALAGRFDTSSSSVQAELNVTIRVEVNFVIQLHYA